MESYRAILDSANIISAVNTGPGRSAPVQTTEMDVSPETMSSMQKNAVYGMEVLDAALKHVRGESPTVAPVSVPQPTSGPTLARMVGQGASNSVKTATTTSSSSLAGAVASSQEAAAPAPASSTPKPNTALKGNKDVGAIRVIEDGPLKKLDSKEGVAKSSDRKRQVRRHDCFLWYTFYSDAQSTLSPPRKQQKTANMRGRLV